MRISCLTIITTEFCENGSCSSNCTLRLAVYRVCTDIMDLLDDTTDMTTICKCTEHSKIDLCQRDCMDVCDRQFGGGGYCLALDVCVCFEADKLIESQNFDRTKLLQAIQPIL